MSLLWWRAQFNIHFFAMYPAFRYWPIKWFVRARWAGWMRCNHKSQCLYSLFSFLNESIWCLLFIPCKSSNKNASNNKWCSQICATQQNYIYNQCYEKVVVQKFKLNDARKKKEREREMSKSYDEMRRDSWTKKKNNNNLWMINDA